MTSEEAFAWLESDVETAANVHRSNSGRAQLDFIRAQFGNMLAVLKEIDATWPVATSELRERVRKVIAEAEPACDR